MMSSSIVRQSPLLPEDVEELTVEAVSVVMEEVLASLPEAGVH